jgi:predicted RNase H-like HicB family nuclease
MSKTVEEFMSLPYSMTVRMDPAGGIFVARVTEFPGCSGHGDSAETAIRMLQDNMATWIEACLASNVQIPKPMSVDELPSGKWLQRVPKTLHADLIELSRNEETSLNQLVVTILSRYVGSESIKCQFAGSLQTQPPTSFAYWDISNDKVFAANWKVDSVGIDHSAMAFLHHLVQSIPSSSIAKLEGNTYGETSKHSNWP